MNKDVLLSIVIPVYNTEPYLKKCLDSVLEKIPEHTEIIVVNDGSPDNSDEILKEYAKNYKGIIRYYKKENGGLSHTKNYGLKHAKGKYITFVDSDDWIDPNMHREMLKKALKEDADIVYCDVEMVYENGKTRYIECTTKRYKEKLMQVMDNPLMAASWNKIVKKSLYQKLEYPVGMNNEDIAVTPILFARAKKICKINKAFYKYLQRSGSIQNSGFTSKRFVAIDSAKLCMEAAQEFPKKIQEQIQGAIYTHQLLALLIYPISFEPKEKRLQLILEFCTRMSVLQPYGDMKDNHYIVDYLSERHCMNLLEYIPEFNVSKINHDILMYRYIYSKRIYHFARRVWHKIIK